MPYLLVFLLLHTSARHCQLQHRTGCGQQCPTPWLLLSGNHSRAAAGGLHPRCCRPWRTACSYCRGCLQLSWAAVAVLSVCVSNSCRKCPVSTGWGSQEHSHPEAPRAFPARMLCTPQGMERAISQASWWALVARWWKCVPGMFSPGGQWGAGDLPWVWSSPGAMGPALLNAPLPHCRAEVTDVTPPSLEICSKSPLLFFPSCLLWVRL